MIQYTTEKYKTYTIANLKKEIIIPSKSIIEKLTVTTEILKDPRNHLNIHVFNMNQIRISQLYDEITGKIDNLFPSF